tara:strand:- start:1401 stop:3464 length:2064 start_codon:yes stop_codon:yes gene_type:complete
MAGKININQLLTDDISLSDFLVKADTNGLATKATIQALINKTSAIGDVSFKGSLSITEALTAVDGWYFANETGNYVVNSITLAVTVSDNLAILIIGTSGTTFVKVDIPVNITIDSVPTDGSSNAVQSNGVFDSLKENRDALNTATLKGKVSIIDQVTTVGYINTSGVLVSGDNNFRSSGFIETSPGYAFDLDMIGHLSVNSISFYDSSNVFISGILATSSTCPNNLVQKTVTTPLNTAYIRLSMANTVVFPTCNLGYANECLKYEYIKDEISTLKVDVLANTTLIEQVQEDAILTKDLIPQAVIVGYINNSGVIVSGDNNWRSTDYISAISGDIFYLDIIGYTTLNSISFYNSSNVFISGLSATSNTCPDNLFKQTATAPTNTAYIRLSMANTVVFPTCNLNYVNKATVKIDLSLEISALNTSTNNNAINKVYTSRRKLDLQSTDKVILYGTSISSTDYPWYKEAFEDLTVATIYRGGFSGHTAAQNASNTSFQRIIDYGAKLVVAMTGGNDTGAVGTVGTFNGEIFGESIVSQTDVTIDYNGTKFIQAVDHIMRKFKLEYNNIRTRANLNGSETEAEKTAKIDAVLKPTLVFCTPLPQKRVDASNAYSVEANWLRKRAAVLECSRKNDINCVDLFLNMSFDMSIEPYFTSPTNTTVNNGVYFMDGLHPNKYGYRNMAENVCSEVVI